MSSRPGLLVTGASGFVGRHVVALARNRFNIIGSGRGTRPDWLPADVAWLSVDLLDRASVAILPCDLPFVMHLASETVPSMFASYEPLLDSLEMTLNLCRHLRSGRLLFASSCLVYAANDQPLLEESRLDPRGHYGLTKRLCEEIVLRTGLSPAGGSETVGLYEGGIETVIARPFSHLGGGMRPDLVIPSIIQRVRSAEEGATIEMAGLDSIRDFLHVEDIIAGYFAILELPELSERIFNVASGKGTSIGEIVRTVADILGKPIGDVNFTGHANSGDDTSIVVGDARKLRRTTGWTPQVGLADGLRKMMFGPRI